MTDLEYLDANQQMGYSYSIWMRTSRWGTPTVFGCKPADGVLLQYLDANHLMGYWLFEGQIN